MQTRFRNSLLASSLALGAVFMSSATAGPPDRLVWKSIAGITQPSNHVGSLAGIVFGSGLPWSTLGGHAVVDLRNGTIEFDVRGLVFAGGNFIGTPGTVEQVKGTLVCNTTAVEANGTPALVDTPLVPLDDRGNAYFAGNVGPLPPSCHADSQIAFLIRAANQRWIAYGAVLQ